ncbi:MAG: hypothetical protein ACR9NN_01350 [Nostochopsis sp.]
MVIFFSRTCHTFERWLRLRPLPIQKRSHFLHPLQDRIPHKKAIAVPTSPSGSPFSRQKSDRTKLDP